MGIGNRRDLGENAGNSPVEEIQIVNESLGVDGAIVEDKWVVVSDTTADTLMRSGCQRMWTPYRCGLSAGVDYGSRNPGTGLPENGFELGYSNNFVSVTPCKGIEGNALLVETI